MKKLDLLGNLLQSLRQERNLGRGDMTPALFRVLSEIHKNMVHHGYLTRRMFAYDDLNDPHFGVPEHYSHYQTICVPDAYLLFGWAFQRWLTGDDGRERLEFADLLTMIQESEIVDVSYVKRGGKAHALVSIMDEGDSRAGMDRTLSCLL
ncbi:MAG: hypothetical protein KL801_15525 [Mesorhizobium sp.]|nr:hypothetical protein [Mesorhizobium sp.]